MRPASILAVVLVSAFLIRIAPVISYSYWTEENKNYLVYRLDPQEYHEMALIFVDHGVKGIFDKENELYIQRNFVPTTAMRPPLYPLFLAGIYSVAGPDPIIALVFQVLLDLGTLGLVFHIARRISKNEWIALFAAILYAVNPFAFIYTTYIGPETLFGFLFAVSMLASLELLQSMRFRHGLAAGAALGLATLAKPIALYFPMVLAVILGIVAWKRGRTWLPRAAKAAGVTLVTFLAVISVWQVRNLIVYGHYSLTMQQGRELHVAMVGWCMTWREDVSQKTLLGYIEDPYKSIGDPFVRSRIQGQEALKYIAADPLRFAGCMAQGVWGFFRGNDFFQIRSKLTPASNHFLDVLIPDQFFWMNLNRIGTWLLWILYACTIAGIFLLRRNKSVFYQLLFLCTAVMYVAILTGSEGNMRYLFPMTPLLAVVGGIAIAALSRKLKRAVLAK